MAIVRRGTRNVLSLIHPQLLTEITLPSVTELNGVPTNQVGIVGSASYGPKNVPITVGDNAGFQRAFGKPQNKKHDAGTTLATAAAQAANNFTIVRVTDNTDVVATSVHAETVGNTLTNAISFHSIYTGSGANDIQYGFSTGSKAGTAKAVVRITGIVEETYDNLPNDGTFWSTLANAITTGDVRYARNNAPSGLVTAVAGTANAAPTADGSYTNLAGGTDGADGVNAVTLVGSEQATGRTGMYAMRKQGVSIGVLADCDDPTSWSSQVEFGIEEGVYMIGTGAAGETIAQAIANKASAGIDDPAMKLMFGDWLWWSDQVNGVTRLVSPQGFVAGCLANLSPEGSSLNKPLQQVIGSQKVGLVGSGSTNTYSDAELDQIIGAGLDLISNPCVGRKIWAVQSGTNTSSNGDDNGDNYTRMTNFIAATIDAGMNFVIGEPLNDDLESRAFAALNHFMQILQDAGILAPLNGQPCYSVVCDASNNPPEMTAKGYLQAEVKVRYQPITRYFLIDLQGGQSVTITVNNNATL